MMQEILSIFMKDIDLKLINQIIIIILSSSVIGSVICMTFKYSFSKAIYSKGMCISLMMITILSAILTNILMSNVKLAIGALGALSVVRFRNVIKDPRDIVFVLWSLITGICCGISEFMFVGIGSFCAFLVIALMNEFYTTERFMISVIGHGNIESEISKIFNKFLSGRAKMKVNNSNKKSTELIYQLPKMSVSERESTTQMIKEKLYEINEIQTVNVFCQSEDMEI